MRLYTAGDFAARPAFEAPEIGRLDLSEALLEIVAHGVGDPSALSWLEPPPASAVDGALGLLRKLDAIQGAPPSIRVTATGERMLAFPAHPRHARIIVEGERRGVAHDCAGVAAILGERSPDDARAGGRAAERSDVTAILSEIERGGRSSSLDRDRATVVRRAWERLSKNARNVTAPPLGDDAREEAIGLAVLMGYPDRVARLRRPEGPGKGPIEVLFASGGAAVLSEASRVREAELIVAADVEERTEGMRTRAAVRLASAVDPDWLLEHFIDEITDEETLEIPPGSRRVEAVRTLRFGSIVLERSRAKATDTARAAGVLARALLAAGLSPDQTGAIERLRARIDLCRAHAPEVGLQPLADELESVVAAGCEGLSSLDEAASVDFAGIFLSRLPGDHQRALRELAPDKLALPSGRSLGIDYRRDAPPSVASRLQDFFGMSDAPKIVRGRAPLVLHLLAPNGRDVQVTTDLGGFWDRHYPAIAKELRRKYPRHAWPDDPRRAEPPVPKRR